MANVSIKVYRHKRQRLVTVRFRDRTAGVLGKPHVQHLTPSQALSLYDKLAGALTDLVIRT